ncbi:MAG: 7-cyano-7-deazaguanine synthase [Acidobacteriota bacterium]
MPTAERIILCGGVSPPPRVNRENILPLRLGLGVDEIRLKIADITKRLAAELPPVMTDLVEVASYVYCADQAVTRGGNGVLNFGQRWRRHLSFHIPVRAPEVWSSPEVVSALQDTLSFLSDDQYRFHFSKQRDPTPIQSYLELRGEEEEAQDLDEVLLFSGGLDSLGGAIVEAVRDQRRVALVSHRSNPKINSKQKALVAALQKRCQQKPFHMPVWVQKGEALDREYTQRTRSFLFAALGAVVARAFGLRRIRFYENGIVSLNLPISSQVVGGRATRTTHPQVLMGFASLFRMLTEGPFEVENPFLWLTKSEVVELIGDNGSADLIKHSVSCTHTREMTLLFTHCGKCSQCISRRFATLASKYGSHDPAEMYKVDLLTGDREAENPNSNVDITMLESFVRIAEDMRTKNEYQLVEMFPEVGRVLRHVQPLSAEEVASRVARMHQTHAKEVNRVLCDALASHSAQVLHQELPRTCAIILAFPEKYKTAPPADDGQDVRAKRRPKKRDPYHFDTPAGTTWHGILLRFLDGHTVSIVIDSRTERRTFAEMNMKDGRNGNPTKQWKLLETLAQHGGRLSWRNPSADLKLKKQVELLAHRLQEYFSILESPFHDYKKGFGWQLKLRLEAPR